MAFTCSCLIESDLLGSKYKCSVQASTLGEFLAKLVASIPGLDLPVQALSFDVLEPDFQEYVGMCLMRHPGYCNIFFQL
jgi:hypothetical protein